MLNTLFLRHYRGKLKIQTRFLLFIHTPSYTKECRNDLGMGTSSTHPQVSFDVRSLRIPLPKVTATFAAGSGRAVRPCDYTLASDSENPC